MRIEQVIPKKNGILHIVAEDGRTGFFDVSPYLDSDAFKPLKDWREFSLVRNNGYFIEWRCGADLSATPLKFGRAAPELTQEARKRQHRDSVDKTPDTMLM